MSTNFDNVAFGKKDGVEVFHNEKTNEVVVVCPNQYDLYWQLRGKTQEGTQYSNQVMWNDTNKLNEVSFIAKKSVDELKKKMVLTVPAENLNSPEKQQYFNNKVNKTRERVIEASKEYNQFFFKKDQDGTYKTRTISDKLEEYSYKAAFEQPGDRKPNFHFAKNDKNNPVLSGEVAHAGKYYVVLYTGHDQNNINFEIINTGKFLKGEDLKEQNRERAVQEICPVGEKIYIDRDKLGNVLEVSKEPIALEKNHPELVAINKAVEAAKQDVAQAPKAEPTPKADENVEIVKKAPAKKKAAVAKA